MGSVNQDLLVTSINSLIGNIPPGTVIRDRYVVEEYLGSGTSASVYKCHDKMLGNLPVALKAFPAEILEDKGHSQRLLRELQTNFGVDHENIARFYDCIRTESIICLVMEYVNGGDLEEFIKTDRKITYNQLKFILTQISAGLTAIHEKSIIHRDLKLTNILVTSTNLIKITDFGLARINQLSRKTVDGRLKNQDSLATETGDVVGTPLYLAPEYLESDKFDQRSDIYAFGVVGYELLTGTEPYVMDGSFFQFIEKKISQDPVPPHEINPDCPEDLSFVIMRALKRDPAERFQTARVLYRTLQQIELEEEENQRVYYPGVEYKDDDHDVAESARPELNLSEMLKSLKRGLITGITVYLPTTIAALLIVIFIGIFGLYIHHEMNYDGEGPSFAQTMLVAPTRLSAVLSEVVGPLPFLGDGQSNNTGGKTKKAPRADVDQMIKEAREMEVAVPDLIADYPEAVEYRYLVYLNKLFLASASAKYNMFQALNEGEELEASFQRYKLHAIEIATALNERSASEELKVVRFELTKTLDLLKAFFEKAIALRANGTDYDSTLSLVEAKEPSTLVRTIWFRLKHHPLALSYGLTPSISENLCSLDPLCTGRRFE